MPDAKRKPMHPLFAVLTLLFGAMFVAVGTEQRINGHDSTNWPVVPAVVTASKIEHESSASINMAAGEDRYHALITYRYEHEGTAYEHTGFNIGGSLTYSIEDRAVAFIASYPVGSRLKVHVNPARPDTAVVEIGVPKSSGSLLYMGIFVMLFGVVLLIEWIRAKRSIPAKP